MPINIGLLKLRLPIHKQRYKISSLQRQQALIKVVVDLGQLTREEQIKAALIAKMTGASDLKVAAGSKPDGVTADDIKLIRSAVGPDMGIKADGGIRNHQRAVEVIEAGATRLVPAAL